jgi:hypothetical protein
MKKTNLNRTYRLKKYSYLIIFLFAFSLLAQNQDFNYLKAKAKKYEEKYKTSRFTIKSLTILEKTALRFMEREICGLY